MGGVNLTGIVGLIGIPLLAYLLSTNRKAIRWKTVFWGFGLQLGFALIVLKWEPGIRAFQYLGQAINHLLDYSRYGSEFVFGPLGSRAGLIRMVENLTGRSIASSDPLMQFVGVFALQVLPTIIFIAALFAILYYLGVMQIIVRIFARVMSWVMGASGAESLNVAASIFMGQTEAPLTIRPFLAKMTQSELMCVMTSGMAHISGGIMAAYIAFGAKAEHLLTAVIMTAPGTIMMAKLLVPETEKPETMGKVKLDIPKTDVNIIDAACRGTGEGMHLAMNVAAMLISFIALIALFNGILGLIPVAGAPLSMERMFGWVFAPIAWAMGVPWADCTNIGNLLGTRLVLNEFIAYMGLGNLKDVIDPRSFTIATFALCGFANFSSIGIQIGGIGALAPSRRHDLARLGFKAVLAGTLANFMTASIAGILIVPAPVTITPPAIVHQKTVDFPVTFQAVLAGSVDPKGNSVDCWFEYSPDSVFKTENAKVTDARKMTYRHRTDKQVLTGTGPKDLEAVIRHLPAGSQWHYRLVVFSGKETVHGEDQSFTVPRLPLPEAPKPPAPSPVVAEPAAPEVSPEAGTAPTPAAAVPVGTAQPAR